MPILLGIIEVILNLVIQSLTVATVFSLLLRHTNRGTIGRSFSRDTVALASMMVILFLGHLVHIALWAVPFRVFGEFSEFHVAFYHSAVNYTSLGYGDIVMSEDWRILGALEAACGVLMFGVSTAAFFAIMRHVFGLRQQDGSAIPRD